MWTLGVASAADEITIREKVQLAGIEQLEFVPLSPTTVPVREQTGAAKVGPGTKSVTAPSGKKKVQQGRAGQTDKKPTETLRVDIERLDHLMNLTGQLVINKARFSRIGEGLTGLMASKQANHSLTDAFGLIDRLAKDLDDNDEPDSPPINLNGLRSQARRIRIDLEGVQREVDQFTQARLMINDLAEAVHQLDRKSTRLNSSHVVISYAVFCLKKKNSRT